MIVPVITVPVAWLMLVAAGLLDVAWPLNRLAGGRSEAAEMPSAAAMASSVSGEGTLF